MLRQVNRNCKTGKKKRKIKQRLLWLFKDNTIVFLIVLSGCYCCCGTYLSFAIWARAKRNSSKMRIRSKRTFYRWVKKLHKRRSSSWIRMKNTLLLIQSVIPVINPMSKWSMISKFYHKSHGQSSRKSMMMW